MTPTETDTTARYPSARASRHQWKLALGALAVSLVFAGWVAFRPDPDRTPREVVLEGSVRAAASCAEQGPCEALALAPSWLEPSWLDALSHVQRRYFVLSRAPAFQLTRSLPAGSYSFRVNADGARYGAGGRPDGPEVQFELAEPRSVTFLYSADRHTVTADAVEPVVIAVGDFQRALGCKADFDERCLHTWLQDPDGDGRFTLETRLIPEGTWEVRPSLPLAEGTHFVVKKRFELVLLAWHVGGARVTVEFPERPLPLPGEDVP